MRYSLILLILILLLALSVRYLLDPEARMSTNPARDLHEMTVRDPDLGDAIAEADQGNVGDLTTWINRADPYTRERLATLFCLLLREPGKQTEDPVLCWKYRYRFRAFLGLSTGSDKLDATLTNLLAYTLVTGTDSDTPTESDIKLAESLEPRLKHDAKDANDPNIEDTIGCIQFAAHDFGAAKESFAQALTYVAQNRDAAAHGLEDLERKRLSAANRNAQLMAGHHDDTAVAPSDLEPLPKEPPEPAAAGTAGTKS